MLLSEMFGVERDTDFKVKGYEPRFRLTLNVNGFEHLKIKHSGSDMWETPLTGTIFNVISVAPLGIIHLPPPLTDEQLEQLRHIYGLGGRYLAKDCDGKAFYYYEMPHNNGGYWHDGNDQVNDGFGLELLCSLSVCEILSKSDPEPYDIGKALGVEG